MTLCAQKLKMRCAFKSDAAAVCAKLKTVSKLIAIYLYMTKIIDHIKIYYCYFKHLLMWCLFVEMQGEIICYSMLSACL
jgi:hypothetical protein